jgi:hypothetical protein
VRAQAIADGLAGTVNACIRSDTAPTTRTNGSALVAGDVWEETDQGNLPWTWTGSAWQRAYTVIDGGNITTGTVTANKLSADVATFVDSRAQAITDGAVAPLASVIRATSAPAVRDDGSALQAGDWWVDTDDGNAPWQYDGASWVRAYTRIDGGSIVTGTVSANRVAIGSGTTFDAGYNPSALRAVIRAASAPAVRGDGTALVAGDVWIETDNGDAPHSWDGSSWVRTYTSIDGGDLVTGTVTANKLNVTELSAIVAALGTVVSGLMKNAASSPTAAIRLDSGSTLPGTATSYLDLAATGSAIFLKVGGVELRVDGSHTWPTTVLNPPRLGSCSMVPSVTGGTAEEYEASWSAENLPSPATGWTVEVRYFKDLVYQGETTGTSPAAGTASLSQSGAGGTKGHAEIYLLDASGNTRDMKTTRQTFFLSL